MILSKNNIDFTKVEVGTTKVDSFQITNTELFVLNVSLTFDNLKFTSSILNYNIPVSGSIEVIIEYSPTFIVSDTGRVTINSNDTFSPVSYVDFLGQGVTTEIQVSRNSINYGDVSYEQEKTEYLVISNSSHDVDLRISNISFSNPLFSINETLPIIISPFGQKQIDIKFIASSLGVQNCDLSIDSNDFYNPETIISLTSTVLQPEIVVSPVSLNFGNVAVGSSKQENLVISNYDVGELHVNASSSDSSYVLSQTTIVVSGTSSSVLVVNFSPITSGNKPAIITLTTNDPDHPIVEINIEGIAKNSDIAVSKNSIDFGLIGAGDTKQEILRISCVGTIELIVSDIIVSSSTFSVSMTNFTLQPGYSQDINVIFSPSSISTFSETLLIKNNSAAGDITVNLFGRSTSAGIFVDKTTINFGNVTIKDTKTENILVSNISVDDIDLVLRSVTTTNPLFKETIDTFRIEKGNALQIPVTFMPVNVALQTGKLRIESNDQFLPVVEVDLQGTGIVAPNILLSTTQISFGNVEIGKTIKKTFQIFNSGVSTLNVSNVVTNNSKFSVIPSNASIVPNGTVSFEVSFTPLDTTTVLGKISITSNDPDSPASYINLQGTGLTSSIEIEQQNLSFGNVSIGDTKVMSLMISNKSSVVLIIDSVEISDSNFSISETFPIEIQTYKALEVRFEPDSIGLVQGSLVVFSNDLNNPEKIIDLTGSGVTPDISVQPNFLNFFNVAVGQNSSLSISISNIGLGRLVVSNIESDESTFSPSVSSIVVEPKQTQTINVIFTPTEMGQKSGFVTFTNNDPDSPDIVISVTGFGAYPVAEVSPMSINFGPVVINSTKESEVRVNNLGRAELDVSMGSSSPQYTTSTSSLRVQQNGSESFKVTFAPSSVSSFTGFINLSTNDPEHSSIPIVVTGSGIVAPKIVVNPRSLSFGEVAMGSSKQLILTISNQGTQLLTFDTSIENPIRPGRPPTFVVSPTEGSVPISSNKQLTASFRPGDPEQLSGTLKITSNDLSEPLIEISLQGSGKPAVLEWDKINTSQWIPREIRSIANSVSNIVGPLVSALELTNQVFEIIKLFVIDIDDVMKIMLEQVKKLIQDFINDLAATGLYVLYVLPGKPGITPLTYPQYFRDLSTSDFNIFDPNNPSWFDSVKGGYSSFVAKVVDSFDDPGDGNRPQFSNDGMVGGYVFMFDSGSIGPDDIAKFIRSIQKLTKMFRSPFKVAFEPPSNVTTFSANKLVRVTFTPSASVLPKEYFIFRSETQGGSVDTYEEQGQQLPYHDENGKPIRSYKLVGITNVADQFAKIMGVSETNAKSMLGEVGYAAKQLSKTFLSDDPFRFVFEDKEVDNDKTYYYVVAAGYTTSTVEEDEYPTIIGKNILTSDFEKKIISASIMNPETLRPEVIEYEINPKSVIETNILCVGAYSPEVSAKPIDVALEVKGGLARCRNFRCGFDQKDVEFVDITGAEAPDFISIANTPIAGSVKIKVVRKGLTQNSTSEFIANQSTYRVDYTPKNKPETDSKQYEGSISKIFFKNRYYYKSGDRLEISYKYLKDLKTSSTQEGRTLDKTQTFLTNKKPIDSSSVKVTVSGVELPSSDVIVLNDKDGKIKVKKPSGTSLIIKYDYFTDFSEKDFFRCTRPEYSRYFFDISKCDAGSTLCPGYDNANCYYNNGSECTNSNKSQRKVLTRKEGIDYSFEAEDIPYNLFWDPISCQNGVMKQRCDGYSKTFPRYAQKTWPDWSSVRLSAIGLFPKIEELMNLMNTLLDSLLAGTEKMSTATTNFIDLLQKKVNSLRELLETIQSFMLVITEDFVLPDLYMLSIPYARGGNNYLKTSIKNAIEGPISDSTAYTAGVVVVYGTPGLGNALKLFFG